MTSYTVSVRELVEFVCRTGDLGSSRAFASPTRASEGIEGHKRIQDSRPEGYVREFAVVDSIATPSFQLKLRGRIDGYWHTPSGPCLEEIKTRTTHEPPGGAETALHWAQAKIYGALLLRVISPPCQALRLQLTYLHIPSNSVEEREQVGTRAELETFYNTIVQTYLEWLVLHSDLVKRRNQSLDVAPFPFPRFRSGQRELAKIVYHAAMQGGRVFAEAPTGIGKTISTLFPALKAMGAGSFQRLLYLTAKTPGRTIAENALRELQTAGAQVRSITLTARSRLCARDGVPCETRTCPLAIGYFDRRHDALRQVLNHKLITRAFVEEVGQKFRVCPYALSIDLAPWMDVVIGDYNHLFDPRSRLAFLDDQPCEVFVLIDEAHNLVDRSREMFSTSLSPKTIEPVRKRLKAIAPALAKALGAIERALKALLRENRQTTELEKVNATYEAASEAAVLDLPLFQSLSCSRLAPTYRAPAGNDLNQRPNNPEMRNQEWAISEPPALPEKCLDDFLKLGAAWLSENTAGADAQLLEDLGSLYFEIGAWLSTLRRFDERYVTLFEMEKGAQVTLFCLDPSGRLRETLDSCSGAVFFSATLSPLEYFRTLLGGDETDRSVAIPSPFPPRNFRVLINDRVPTTFRARSDTLEQVVDSMGAFIEAHIGNYMVFFPSHRYLADVLERFRTRMPDIKVAIQEPQMTEEQRAAFLGIFAPDPHESRLGFAVMGGIFGEGIDLVGDRLSGAIVVGVGLPQISFKRNVIRDFFEKSGRPGFEYAYAFPGINRVIQAAGRVVRSETDRGLLLLIDARFRETRYHRLLPVWWTTQTVRNEGELSLSAKEFWG